jgi:hypothetical protein
MNRSLVWFGVLYGNLNALVVLAVAGGIWVEKPSGQAFCSKFALDIGTCRVSIMMLVFTVLGTSTALSFRKLMQLRRPDKISRPG